MTVVIHFNTATHVATVNESYSQSHHTYTDITTIKDNGRYYEMFKKTSEGVTVPILRTPIESTIIYYSHEDKTKN